MSDPLQSIGIIIVNFNGGEYLRNCLDSLIGQDHPANSIIVVDNASTDGSIDCIQDDYPSIQLMRQGANIGFAAANNIGFDALSDCQWAVTLNPDTLVQKDWLKVIREAIHKYPKIDMFSCRLVDLTDPDKLDGTGDCYHLSGIVWRRDHGAPSSISRTLDEPIFAPCGAAAVYRLEMVRKVGGMDTDYFCYNEDIDLGFRMRLMGAQCLHIDSAVVFHAGSGITGKDSDFTVYHGHRNLIWTYVKNMPGYLLWITLPLHLAMNLIVLILYIARGRIGVISKSKWDGILKLPQAFRKRKQIQAARQVRPNQLLRVLCKGFKPRPKPIRGER